MNTLFTWVFILSFKGAIQELKIYESPDFADIQCTDLSQVSVAKRLVIKNQGVTLERRRNVFSYGLLFIGPVGNRLPVLELKFRAPHGRNVIDCIHLSATIVKI